MVMSLLIALICLTIFAYFPARLKRQARSAIADKAFSMSEMAAFSLGPALATGDRPKVAEALVGIRGNPDLVYLMVLDASGQPFGWFNESIAAQYRYGSFPMSRREGLFPARNQPGGPRFAASEATAGGFSSDDKIYQSTTTIRDRGHLVGRIFIGLSLDRLNEEIARSRATIALVSLIIFTLGVVASFVLSRAVTGPLRAVVKTAERISAGDMQQRAAVPYDDEVGQLARSFNVMLDRLGAAHDDLEILNQGLEARVELRTAELRDEIEERKRAETLVRSSEERYRLLYERNLAGVYVSDVNGRLLACNDACARVFGYSSGPELMRERGTIAYQKASDRKEIIDRLKREGAVINQEVQLWGREGATVWALENVRLVEGVEGRLPTMEGILLDISDRKRAEQEVEYKAYHDSLTGLPNRRLFEDRLTIALALARRTGRSVAVMFLDLDEVKSINDTFGHQTGDLVLKEVAGRLRSSLREEDSVARVGGDEFTILLPDINDEADASLVAEKILACFTQPVHVEKDEIHLTTSIGVAVYPTDGDNVEALLRNADATMYRVKEAGGNNFQFSSHITGRRMGRQSMEEELRRAIERDELTVFYQPQVDIHTREVVGVEALVRWKHPEHVLIEPSGFIGLAEQTGLIIPMGELVLRKACRQIKRWEMAGLASLRVAVNVSARQFHQRDFVGMVERILNETSLDSRLLELEITESLAMQRSDWTIKILGQLREMGIGIAMDDFGTGQASLSYLKRFPIDKVKIDKSFITEIASQKSDASIVTAILLLANSLNLRTVAEGVETEEQCQILARLDCQHIQGYLISRPVSADVFQRRFLVQMAATANATRA